MGLFERLKWTIIVLMSWQKSFPKIVVVMAKIRYLTVAHMLFHNIWTGQCKWVVGP
jgi:hypothetical protein